MQVGVIIETGLQDWQIVQQKGKSGSIVLEGFYNRDNLTGGIQVYARVASEETGETVISWTGAEMLENNRWKVCITDIPVGGLYRVETCLKATKDISYEWAVRGDIVRHIGVGDIYVIAGQSNAAGYGKDPVCDGPELGVHLYANNDQWDLAAHPMNDSTNTKHEVNREWANSGTSPYLSFGKYLKRILGYPIGLIQASLGGSSMEWWNPKRDGRLYRNMMERIQAQGGSVKGILWYQGCSDTGEGQAEIYEEQFCSMVKALRKDLNMPVVPILSVQLNRLVAKETSVETDLGWNMIREVQRVMPKKEEGVYVVPSIDGAMSDDIHNASCFNILLGERLARTALNKIYGHKIICDAPDILYARKKSEKQIELRFSHVQDYLYSYAAKIDEIPFVVEDEEGINAILQYELDGKDGFLLTMSRKMGANCKVHNCYGANFRKQVFVDYATHYPILAFYNVMVQEGD